MPDRPPLLEISGLKTHFFLEQGIVRAVDGVNLTVHRGETVGIVGESGCGKSVMARSILRIVPPPGHIVEGQILFHQSLEPADRNNGSAMSRTVDLVKLDGKGKEVREIRGAEISMVFQEPMTSLSPVHTIGAQIEEAILLHQDVSEGEARDHAIKMLESVGMPRPRDIIDRYPHQLSGGMR